MTEIEVFAFIGPSLWQHGSRTLAKGNVRTLPPCRPGDLAALVESHSTPRAVALIDLDFHHPPALTHREILSMIRAGWQVWGLAGLGAARGFELRALGMFGFGQISDHFRRSKKFCDDEVICLHRAEPPYTAASEPLVHIREALSWLVARDSLDKGAAQRIAKVLKQKWFGERTIEMLNEMLREQKVDGNALSELSGCFDTFRLQHKDIERFFVESPWQAKFPRRRR